MAGKAGLCQAVLGHLLSPSNEEAAEEPCSSSFTSGRLPKTFGTSVPTGVGGEAPAWPSVLQPSPLCCEFPSPVSMEHLDLALEHQTRLFGLAFQDLSAFELEFQDLNVFELDFRI